MDILYTASSICQRSTRGGAGDAAQNSRRSEEVLANTDIDSFPITNTAARQLQTARRHTLHPQCTHYHSRTQSQPPGIAVSASTKHSPSQTRAATTEPSPTHSLTRHNGRATAADKARHTARDGRRFCRAISTEGSSCRSSLKFETVPGTFSERGDVFVNI